MYFIIQCYAKSFSLNINYKIELKFEYKCFNKFSHFVHFIKCRFIAFAYQTILNLCLHKDKFTQLLQNYSNNKLYVALKMTAYLNYVGAINFYKTKKKIFCNVIVWLLFAKLFFIVFRVFFLSTT